MPQQIKRHLIVLAVLVTLFLIIRYFMVPDSFGELGHYRSASLQDNAEKEIVFAGDESCLDCHEDMGELLEMDLHSNLSCESCHGPGLEHNQDPFSADLFLPENREYCERCHAENAARDRNMVSQINVKEHNPDKNCNYCHNPHAPWELRNQETEEEN